MLFFVPEGKLVFSTESTQQIPHTEPTESEAPTGPDYSAASVVDAATAALTYDGLEMEYHVPMIVFEGEGIDYLSAMIYAELYDGIYTEDVMKAINENGMPGVCYITYLWGVSDEYVSDACAFVGVDGKLWMVAPIASVAGADCYNQVIEFENYPISDAYLNYIAGDTDSAKELRKK